MTTQEPVKLICVYCGSADVQMEQKVWLTWNVEKQECDEDRAIGADTYCKACHSDNHLTFYVPVEFNPLAIEQASDALLVKVLKEWRESGLDDPEDPEDDADIQSKVFREIVRRGLLTEEGMLIEARPSRKLPEW